MSDERWIQEAVRLALEARERGDEPFGALLVKDDVAILTARNAIRTDQDLTQNAELRLISKASGQLDLSIVAAGEQRRRTRRRQGGNVTFGPLGPSSVTGFHPHMPALR